MTEPRRYEIQAVGIGTGPNQRMHWATRRRKDAPLRDELAWRAKAIAPAVPLPRARVTVTLIHTRFFDPDNAYGCCKAAIDAIKGILIADDSAKHIELMVVQERGTGRFTRIAVEECA